MTTKRRPPAAPRHLKADGRRFWTAVLSSFALEPHELEALRLAAESLDRAAGARAEVERAGLTFTTRHGEVRPHPAVAAERDARASFARLVALLRLPDLDGAPTRGVGRPGRRLS
ncbi:MAG: P27 family phage terminase small subunit [Acidimicrobiia bacterium]